MKPISTLLALILSAMTLLSSCSKENAYQDDANQQNSLESQQKTQELDQVTGTYKGKMYLNQYQQSLDVEIYLDVNQNTATEADGINKFQVPTLGGHLKFPAVSNSSAPMSSFPDLVQAMGQGLQINFTNGDFNSTNSTITLPYSSNGATSNEDQVIGTFQNGTFSGEWDNHSYGTMGTFTNLERSGS